MNRPKIKNIISESLTYGLVALLIAIPFFAPYSKALAVDITEPATIQGTPSTTLIPISTAGGTTVTIPVTINADGTVASGLTDQDILNAISGISDSSGNATAESQAQNYLAPATATTTASTKTNSQQITSNVLGCSVGQILSALIVSGITASLNSLSSLLGVFTGTPVNDSQMNRTAAFQTATSHGFQVFGVYVGVSLDSIAYCIVNTILEYIANSVINWANSGFNGNPSFVENPERFFQSIADQQAASFISSLAYNTTKAVNTAANQTASAVSSSLLGAMNVCSPFRTNVAIGLANSYGAYGNNTAGNAGYASYGSCGLTTSAQDDFLTGTSRKNYFTNMHYVSQYGANNTIDQYLTSSNYLNKMNAQTVNSASKEIDRGAGYLSVKNCTNPSDPNSCSITVPGSTIKSSVQNTVNAGQNRLLLSNKFDQVVTTIVNNLIKIALNKVLTTAGSAISSGTTQLQNSYSSN